MTRSETTEGQPADELKTLRKRIAELEALEVKRSDNKLLQPGDEGLYKAVFESSNDSILLIDRKGKILDFNTRLTKTSGYKKEELIGKNIRSLAGKITKKSLVTVTGNFLKRLAGLHVSPYEVEMYKKNGELLTVGISAQTLKKDGKIIGDLVLLRNVTDRKKAEDELRFKGELLDACSDSLLWHDDDGNPLYLNEAACKAHGYAYDEMMKINIRDLIVPEFRQQVPMKIEEIRKQGDTVFESAHYRKDGSILPLEVHTRVFKWSGREFAFSICRDITERKQAEKALKISEENFRNSIDNSLVGIRISDIDNKTIYANQALLDIFGYKNLSEVIIKSPQEYYSPECHAYYINMREKYGRGEIIPDQVDIDIIRPDGVIRHLQALFKILLWDGKPQYQTMYNDITERKQASAALKASEQNFRNSLDSSSMGINIIDTNFNILYANQALLDIFGYENIDELKASPPSEHYTPESYINWVLRHEKILRGEPIPDKIEVDIVRKDDTIRHLEIFRKAVFWDGRQQYQTLYNDITDRKKAEVEIREQKAFTDRILESTTSAVIVIGHDRRVIMVNKAFEATFELVKSKAEGKEIGEIVPISGFIDAISQVLAGGKSQLQVEFRIKRGITERILEADVISTQKNEVLAFLRDVTDEREMQESLYLTDRLASVGEMAAGVAHELNNPLTGVVALSQLLLENGVPDGMKEDLETISKEGQRAASIVRNLLSFARSHTLSIQSIDINAIVTEVLNLRAYEDKANNIEVITHLAPNLPEIMADRFQMQQVFLNIILNAEQSMIISRGRGNLTVTTEPANGSIRISFTDDGPGIPPEIMNRIFDPFFTTKEVGKGTGLGLSICYGIVANQGGKIHARSEPGKGATFVVELPLNGH